MAEIVGERIEKRMKELGLTQSAVARAVGVKQPSIGRLIAGETRQTRHIIELAQALRTTPEYLTGDTDEAEPIGAGESRQSFGAFPGQSVEDFASENGLMPIRQIDLAFGMGATYLDVPVEEETMLFPMQWVRQFTKAPASKLFFAQGAGDSMQPTLFPNDTLIIDCSQNALNMADQIWAITFCGMGMIKRLRPTRDGGVRIMSDNPHVPEEVAHDGELHLVGRVVAVTRKI